jgi:hypothetical protein
MNGIGSSIGKAEMLMSRRFVPRSFLAGVELFFTNRRTTNSSAGAGENSALACFNSREVPFELA